MNNPVSQIRTAAGKNSRLPDVQWHSFLYLWIPLKIAFFIATTQKKAVFTLKVPRMLKNSDFLL
jgi:hypothetical protein